MRIDLARLSTGDGPEVFQTRQERLGELAADLTALAPGTRSGVCEGISAALTRPAVLRRLASLMAHSVPASVDRLVGLAADDVPLLVAVALQTGLPLARLDDDDIVLGDLHAGESVVAVGAVIGAADARQLHVALVRRGVQLRRTMAVLAAPEERDTMDDTTSDAVAFVSVLFSRDDEGRLLPTKEADDVSG